MENRRSLIIVAAILVVLLVGSYLIYRQIEGNIQANTPSIEETQSEQETLDEAETDVILSQAPGEDTGEALGESADEEEAMDVTITPSGDTI